LAALVSGAALALGALALTLAGFGARPASAAPYEFLPPDHPAYQEIEALAGRGLLDSLQIFTRPLARVDVAAALLRAARLRPEVTSSLHYQRLERELARELKDLGAAPERPETGPLADLGPRERRLRIQSAARVWASYDENRTDDSLRGDDSFQFDDPTTVGARLSLQLWPALSAFEEISITRMRGQREFIDPLIADTDVELTVPRAEITARTGPIVTGLGYDTFRWGPGRRGTLLLSDAAGPMGFLLLQGSFAGSVTLSAVSGVLSSVEDRMMAAHRIEWNVNPKITLGVAEAVRYSSDGIDLLYGIGLIPYTIIERIHVREASTDSTRGEERSNVMASLDLSVKPWRDLTLYGEFLMDDFTTEDETMPDRFGWQAGLRGYRALGRGGGTLRAEYTRVRNYTYSVYYGENFVHRERPTGYTLGPDVENLWIEGIWDLDRDWSARVTADLVSHGEGVIGDPWNPGVDPVGNSSLSGVVERVREFWADARWMPRDNVDLSAGLGYRDVANRAHVPDEDQSSLLARVRAELRY
jgi:hypothetical protein